MGWKTVVPVYFEPASWVNHWGYHVERIRLPVEKPFLDMPAAPYIGATWIPQPSQNYKRSIERLSRPL